MRFTDNINQQDAKVHGVVRGLLQRLDRRPAQFSSSGVIPKTTLNQLT